MYTCVFTCVRLYTNTEIRTGAACLHCNWLTPSQFTYSMCQLGRLPWPLKNDTQINHSVLLGFKHLAAVKYLRLSKFQPFQKKQAEKQYDTFTSHIFQLLHSFIWCHVDLSYGVLWICFGSSVSSSAIIWCHVVTCGGATSILLALKWLKIQEILWWWTPASIWKWLSIETEKYCGDGRTQVSKSG